jgi:beta-glucosidase
MREHDSAGSYGITLNLEPVSALTDRPEDQAAAERALLLSNRLFTDPVLTGSYPDAAREIWSASSDFSFLRDGDLDVTSAALDFLGVNYYFPERVRAVPHREPQAALRHIDDIGVAAPLQADDEVTEMGWPVDADGIRRVLVWLHETYPGLPPVLVTENGRACVDEVDDGQVADSERIRYVDSHLRAIAAAVDAGVEVRGYCHWSLLDNFEWIFGYDFQYGLHEVDRTTFVRTPKPSAGVYADIVKAHGFDS